MSKRFQRVYPEGGRLLLDGGKNSKFERSIIEDNESPDCANVVFTNGAVETRQGVAKLNSTRIASAAIDGLFTRRADTGAETMIVACNGTAYQWTGSTFTTIGSGQSVFTAGVRVFGAQYENHLFVGNGGVIPYKYNGTDWTRHGVYPPTATMTAASAATGAALASGSSYTYKVVFVNSQSVESDVGPATTHVVAINSMGNVALTSIPVAPQSWGVAARRIYRTVAGGSAFKRVVEIADNTTTTYDDAITDAALGAAAPDDKGVPPKYSVILYHQNRLFMNDPTNLNYVWFTDLGEPYTVGALNFIKVGDSSSDLVKALSVYDNSVVAHCEKSQWLIYMPDTDETNWKTVRIKSPFGTKSPFCVLDYNNRQLFAAVQNDKFAGFAALAGDSVEPSATLLTVSTAGSELKSDRIEPDMFQVQESVLSSISGIVYKNKAYIAVPHGTGQTTNNRIWVLDFSISNLSKNQKEVWVPFTGLTPNQFTIYDGDLYFGSSASDGFVYQMESGTYSDAGSAIDSYFWTKEFSGFKAEVNNHKDFRYANILVEKVGSYYMTVKARADSDIGEGNSFQIDLSQRGSLWGVMVWGADSWGGAATQNDYTLDLGNLSGKRVQFKFTNQNTANQRFKVHGMTFTYNVKGRR
jgi:hypothetical protein